MSIFAPLAALAAAGRVGALGGVEADLLLLLLGHGHCKEKKD